MVLDVLVSSLDVVGAVRELRVDPMVFGIVLWFCTPVFLPKRERFDPKCERT